MSGWAQLTVGCLLAASSLYTIYSWGRGTVQGPDPNQEPEPDPEPEPHMKRVESARPAANENARRLSSAFIERSRLGRSIYRIAGPRLEISGWRGLGRYSVTLDLRDISPSIERLGRRFWGVMIRLLVMALVAAAITVALLAQKRAPLGAVLLFAEVSAVYSIAFFLASYRWLSRVEVVRFKSTLGATLFDLVLEQGQARESEEFVEILRESIRVCNDPHRAFHAPEVSASEEPAFRPEPNWKASIMLGAAAAALPFAGQVAAALADWEFFAVFALTCAAMTFCVRSFLKHEEMRFVSVIGAILSLFPAFYQ